MNKSEQREVNKALAVDKASNDIFGSLYAARCIASLHRSAMSKRSQSDLMSVLIEHSLDKYCEWHSGCLIVRQMYD
jgi:hypothetical protein